MFACVTQPEWIYIVHSIININIQRQTWNPSVKREKKTKWQKKQRNPENHAIHDLVTNTILLFTFAQKRMREEKLGVLICHEQKSKTKRWQISLKFGDTDWYFVAYSKTESICFSRRAAKKMQLKFKMWKIENGYTHSMAKVCVWQSRHKLYQAASCKGIKKGIAQTHFENEK